jgi:exodeoxyribonuclease VII large subunit
LRKDLDDLDSRLQQTFERQLQRRREQLVACDRLRETLGYRETLRRGYAVVRSGQALITTVAGVEAAKSLEIEFADGCIAGGANCRCASRRSRQAETTRAGTIVLMVVRWCLLRH